MKFLRSLSRFLQLAKEPELNLFIAKFQDNPKKGIYVAFSEEEIKKYEERQAEKPKTEEEGEVVREPKQISKLEKISWDKAIPILPMGGIFKLRTYLIDKRKDPYYLGEIE